MTAQNSRLFTMGEKCVVRHHGRDVPAVVTMASGNGASLFIQWDAFKHEAMIAGCVGTMPILRDESGVYRCLMNGEKVDLRHLEPGNGK
jgi:hypothetical protein